MAKVLTIIGNVMKIEGIETNPLFIAGSQGNFQKTGLIYEVYDNVYGIEIPLGDATEYAQFADDAAMESFLSNFFGNAPASGGDHATLTNLGWTSSGHTGTNNTLAGFSGTGIATNKTIGIADDNILEVDGTPGSGEFAKFTANGIEGRTILELKTDLSLENVENTALSTWAGSTNITTLGTITSGTWNANIIDVQRGGTGRYSVTSYAVVCGGTTDTGALQTVASLGTSGQVLTSNGAGTLPSFQTIIFGSEFQQNSNDGVSTTTSATYQQKVRITTPAIPAGTYRIGWNIEFMISDEKSDIQTRVQIDDTNTIAEQTGRASLLNLWEIRSGFAYEVLTNAIHTIDLDYNNQSGKTLSVRRGKLEIWRIS